MNGVVKRVLIPTFGACVAAGTVHAGPRDVQFTKIDLSTGIVTLFNFGAKDQPMDGFRLCTADADETFKYTSSTGFNGVTIEAGTEFFLHYLNDAPAGDPNAINIADLGGTTAGPLANGPYGLSIYRSSPFGTPGNMNDYVQFTDSLSNPANQSADARSNIAVMAMLWTGTNDWVDLHPDTTMITLTDDTGGELHGPEDYEIDGSPPPCPDTNGDGVVDTADLVGLLASWGPCPGCTADFNGDDVVDTTDLITLLAGWGPCPG
jgi:hypothetical protein